MGPADSVVGCLGSLRRRPSTIFMRGRPCPTTHHPAAGHRSTAPVSLPLKRGMLYYAHSRRLPVQVGEQQRGRIDPADGSGRTAARLPQPHPPVLVPAAPEPSPPAGCWDACRSSSVPTRRPSSARSTAPHASTRPRRSGTLVRAARGGGREGAVPKACGSLSQRTPPHSRCPASPCPRSRPPADPIMTADYPDFEAFWEQVQEAWNKTWAEVYGADWEGERGRSVARDCGLGHAGACIKCACTEGPGRGSGDRGPGRGRRRVACGVRRWLRGWWEGAGPPRRRSGEGCPPCPAFAQRHEGNTCMHTTCAP